ncbi:TetR/AcrR family transcriptional regulator [Acinetobacter gerneri]|jgi:AcrR family transcriptional regulator|uniref:HTH tetR-type domain-containing protein n=2 Tax=Acinetobacter gerneri TaxID=202952 RepID=N8ZPQ4_9GAMM|nr:TetR/AcrR family transcriptional regulator [Acinetobacter gerneri]ENV33738.1 hypothetical protein F960_02117 [Acinetobacter gerneri DSM 14967 = CIP 107464 = MTCC 9824]EPR82241.1 Transcriptional regulator, TetR family [Acinetobacter gerneri DSM 14967 = CIP 107464 = MTCC 9824]MCH4243397.1 TetR/AcrR family transcriptional regulator [Acinetobacter gerneri]MDQ9008679.1 TetR/AcrR family transcriptional regulator [Acinetobacter gerneri]MDQ9012773.1 TetR/AcrR family transcriptional regulator [Acine
MQTDQLQAGNRRGQRSRKEILNVAVRLMAEKGYAATSVSTLCQETGLPKSAIYHHFQSKSGLLSAVMDHNARRFFDAMQQSYANIPPLDTDFERLNWYLQRTGEVFLSHADFLRLHLILLMSDEAPEISDMITQVRQDGRKCMHQMLQDSFCDYDAELKKAIADRLVYFAVAGFDGAVIELQADPNQTLEESMTLLAESIALMGKNYAEKHVTK